MLARSVCSTYIQTTVQCTCLQFQLRLDFRSSRCILAIHLPQPQAQMPGCTHRRYCARISSESQCTPLAACTTQSSPPATSPHQMCGFSMHSWVRSPLHQHIARYPCRCTHLGPSCLCKSHARTRLQQIHHPLHPCQHLLVQQPNNRTEL